jgi:hypothetical protein
MSAFIARAKVKMRDFKPRREISLKILLGHGGHAGLDAVHADFGEFLGNRHLIRDAEDHSRGLLAVAQRGVVNAHLRR